MTLTPPTPDLQPDVRRVVALLICAVTVVACLVYAWLRDDLPDWWRGHGGGIPYVMFWIAFWFVVFPFRRSVITITVLAVAVTCLLEFLQLWHPDWLTSIRSTRFGAALLGSGFDWNDFPPYFAGGTFGYAVLVLSCRMSRRPTLRA